MSKELSLTSVESMLCELERVGNGRMILGVQDRIEQLIKESEVTDWDGEEPLRRNHRVKYNGEEIYLVLGFSILGRVSLMNLNNEIFTDTDTDNVKPIKTKMERLYDEWDKLPVPVPPAVDPDGKYVRDRYIEFAQFVLAREKGE